MSVAKLVWTALTWALGLGPLSLMAYGLSSADKRSIARK
jgi:hypothetical protein